MIIQYTVQEREKGLEVEKEHKVNKVMKIQPKINVGYAIVMLYWGVDSTMPHICKPICILTNE